MGSVNEPLINSREWAILIWMSILLAWMLWKPDLRSSLACVARALLSWKLLLPMLLLAVWIMAVTWAGSHVGLWRSELSKDTIIWYFAVGIPLLMSMDKAGKPGFIKSIVTRVLAFTVVVEFVIAMFPYSLPVELVLIPVITVVAMTSMVAGMDAANAPAKRLIDGVLAVAGFALLAHSLSRLHAQWAYVDGALEVARLALPIWLAVVTLPFAYGMSVLAGYEAMFVRLRFHREDRQVSARQRAGIIAGLGFGPRTVWNVRGEWLYRFADARSFGDARRVAQRFRRGTDARA